MNKTLTIEGMMCNNCQRHVEKALNAIPGVSCPEGLADQVLTDAVQEEGYTVTAVE